ncbi:MAG: pyridoxal-dependent decarboxylase [Pyrinomonadaceae bacterium]
MSNTRKHEEGRKGVREARPSSLDITEDALRALSEQATALVTQYFTGVSDRPVFPTARASEFEALFSSPLPVEGSPVERVIEDCRAIIEASRHNGHPRLFGYVSSPATPVGAWADLIASTLNQNVTSWRSAPAATVVERTVVRWLSTLVGYGEDAAGLLMSGGSMANLTALHIAHRAKAGEGVAQQGLWNAGAPMTIYASDQVHLSIPKAADLLGIGRDQVRIVGSDERFRLDVRSLRERLLQDERDGLRPFCVVASAGTVNTGAVDAVAEIAPVAREHGLWLHVDGAYGALAALDQSKRALFEGIEQADSLSLDAHKWLYTPVDCGCLLLRDAARARDAFSSDDADYIKVQAETETESFAFWDYGMELSRRFRALKVWMLLRYYGTRRVSAAISEDNELAAYFAARVAAEEEFELLAPVELSICCFRYMPQRLRARQRSAVGQEERESVDAELNRLNERIMHAIQRGGRAYLSNATLRGQYALRACITNFRTIRSDIDTTLDLVREEGMKDEERQK